MLKKLRIKYICIAMLSIILVTSSIFLVITFANYKNMTNAIDDILSIIAENNGKFPESYDYNRHKYMTPETRFSTRYFYAIVDSNNNIISENFDNIYSIKKEEANTMVMNVLKKGKENGFYSSYRYIVTDTETDGEKIVIFADSMMQINSFKRFCKKSIIILIIGYIVIFLCVTIFSKKLIEPISKNIENQKQFVANAGHDLKTPIAVIKADVDVLEMTNGEDNEWIESIKKQANRMENLVKSLITLSCMEGGDVEMKVETFSLKEIAEEQIETFKSLAKNRKITLKINSKDDEDITIKADKNSIRKLLSILLDNAIKYSPDNTEIKIILNKKGNQTIINVENESEEIKNTDFSKVFDRFYRGDKSRNNKKDGYGIGLSMAKTLTELNNGKISADVVDEKIVCFTITI